MVYGYIRVSTDKQTTENQRFEIENFCTQKAYNVSSWIEETISGIKRIDERKLGKLLKKMGKDDILVVTELSRLGRNLMQIMSILHFCMERNIMVCCSSGSQRSRYLRTDWWALFTMTRNSAMSARM